MNKKHTNWIIEEFTTIDLTMPTEAGKYRKSKKFLSLHSDDAKVRFLASETDYDDLGRPKHVINYNEQKEVEAEVQFFYEKNTEKAILFEDNEPASEWVFRFNDEGQVLSREFIDLEDKSKEMEVMTYDNKGYLTSYRQETYENGKMVDDVYVAMEMNWEDGKLKEIIEYYDKDEVASNTTFEYNKAGVISSVKMYLQVEEGEELVEEQKPKFDDKGNVIENTTIFHGDADGTKVIYRYEYHENGELKKTTYGSYEYDDLVQESISSYDEKGQLFHRKEYHHVTELTEIEEYEYEM